MKIGEYLNADEEVWEERFQAQWKKHEYNSIREAIQPLLNDPQWPKLAIDALQQDFDLKALEIAQFYQLDMTQNIFELLEKYPTNSELYIAIMETDNRMHITDICAFAETHFTLSNLSNDEQDCLQCIVQDLYEHEGVGLPLIQAALQSDNGNLQYHALNVLDEWQPTYCQQPTNRELIKNIASKTKDKEDRQLARQLLKK